MRKVGGALGGPGHKAIGAHQHGAQAQPLPDSAGGIGDAAAPAPGQRGKLRSRVKIQQQAGPGPQPRGEPGPVSPFEIRRAAAHQRMAATEIMAQRHAPHPLGEIGRAVARGDEIADDGFQRPRAPGRPHQRHLGARPVEDLRAQRMPLALIAVEQPRRGVAADHGRELPAEVHRVAEPEIEPLAAQRGMDVRSVARQQHPPPAIRARLAGAIGPGGGEPQFRHGDVGARNPAQHVLHMCARDRPGAVERAAVEIHHRDGAGLLIRVHAGRRVMAARAKRIAGEFDVDGIAGELGIGAGEIEAGGLAHGAAAAVAADQPAAAKRLAAGANANVVVRWRDVRNTKAAPDLGPHRVRARGEDGFQMLHLHRQGGAGRTCAVRSWQAIRPL